MPWSSHMQGLLEFRQDTDIRNGKDEGSPCIWKNGKWNKYKGKWSCRGREPLPTRSKGVQTRRMCDNTDAMLKFVSCCNTPVFTATVAAIEFPALWHPCGPVDQLPVLINIIHFLASMRENVMNRIWNELCDCVTQYFRDRPSKNTKKLRSHCFLNDGHWKFKVCNNCRLDCCHAPTRIGCQITHSKCHLRPASHALCQTPFYKPTHSKQCIPDLLFSSSHLYYRSNEGRVSRGPHTSTRLFNIWIVPGSGTTQDPMWSFSTWHTLWLKQYNQKSKTKMWSKVVILLALSRSRQI